MLAASTQRHVVTSLMSLALVAASALIAGAVPAGAAGPTGEDTELFVSRPDFDGDGYPDLAIGSRETVLVNQEGAVNVIYGSASGLTATDNQLWSQDSPGIAGAAEPNDDFGAALGWSDFDGDGYDDLAVGVPGDLVNGKDNAGAVNVIYGSPSGLTADDNQLWSQQTNGVAGTSRASDFFGNAVVARDFNRDGYGDLAIGVFGETKKDGSPRSSGAVQVLYGSPSGLVAAGSQLLFQAKGKAGKFDWFGWTLAVGDFDADDFVDLAVGAPQDEIAGIYQAGSVTVFAGSASGLSATSTRYLTQASSGVVGDPEDGERFGQSLSAADVDDDGFADLAVGIQNDYVGTTAYAGSALVLFGSAKGLRGKGSELWNQDSSGIADVAEEGDEVDDVLMGDFDADGFADLAIGFGGETLGAVEDAGVVHVLYGTASGFTSSGSQFWHQDVAGVLEVVETSDGFGTTLARADFDGDGFIDLAIGVPGESIGAGGCCDGAVNVLYSSASGLTATGNQLWSQDSAGILDTAEGGDFFSGSIMQH